MKQCHIRNINEAIQDSNESDYVYLGDEFYLERSYCDRINARGDDYGSIKYKSYKKIEDDATNEYSITGRKAECNLECIINNISDPAHIYDKIICHKSQCIRSKFDVAMGRRIKELRGMVNMTRRQLSIKSKISYSTINDIENGRTDPTAHTIFKIAQSLDVSIDYILTGKPITVIDRNVETTYKDTTHY